MDIYPFSDIHLEYRNDIPYIPKPIDSNNHTVCLLLGDIGYPTSSNFKEFLEQVSSNFDSTIFVPGNHEWYNNKLKNVSIPVLDVFLNDLCNDTNVIYLNKANVQINKYNFVGTTLWSHINPIRYNDPIITNNNNFSKIYYNDSTKLSPKLMTSLHNDDVAFIIDQLNKYDNNIICTHYPPSYLCLNPKYKYKNDNCMYYTDLEYLLKKDSCKAWFHGHTHICQNEMVCNKPLISNCYGYPDEKTDFKDKVMLTL